MHIRIVSGISVANVSMFVCLGQYMPKVGSRQASLNKLIFFNTTVIFCVLGTKYTADFQVKTIPGTQET